MAIDIIAMLDEMIERHASDLYLTYGLPPTFRVHSELVRLKMGSLRDDDIQGILDVLLTDDQRDELESTLELNTAYTSEKQQRYRVNVYKQQQHFALVIRHISADIPTIEHLGLPDIYKNLIMLKRGLILVVGQTGCGKSTSLAAMIGHRNRHGEGHIITVEDPIEFVHDHINCVISQRDVGIDTYSFGMALKNTLRQRPDIILIGEIRDRETMEHAINFAETGHLCLATLHANNASQAIERVLNFFPEEQHKQVMLNLSINLRAILSQRLVANQRGTRSLAVEIMLNEGFIKELIQTGRVKEIREMMAKSRDQGMQTFDQSLFDLWKAGLITEETALAESDNASNFRLSVKQDTMDKRLVSFGMLTEEEISNSSGTNF